MALESQKHPPPGAIHQSPEELTDLLPGRAPLCQHESEIPWRTDGRDVTLRLTRPAGSPCTDVFPRTPTVVPLGWSDRTLASSPKRTCALILQPWPRLHRILLLQALCSTNVEFYSSALSSSRWQVNPSCPNNRPTEETLSLEPYWRAIRQATMACDHSVMANLSCAGSLMPTVP